jgi:tripartite-type tricarboxylate transporter receptor subunit TctC
MSIRSGALIVALLSAISPALAQDEGIFARKTITIYVGNTAGGTYDLYARLASRHLSRFLPGKPGIVVENMPGAGSLRAANFIAGVAPKDGTALGIVTENVAIEQALLNPAVQYDASKFTWIGRIGPSNAIHAMWHTSKVQSIEDAKKYESTLAGTGAGNLAEIIPLLLNAVLKTKFKLVRGYPAANEALLAMERGEVEGASANWTTIKVQKKEWLTDRKVKIILQDLPTRGPDLQDTPALGELGDTPDDKQLTGLYASVGAIGRSFFGPSGIPAANAAALRDGYIAMTKDPEFLADAQKISAELAPAPGADLQKAVETTLTVPEHVRQRARAIFTR